MSSYTNFYLRRGECFIPIGSWSRNTYIYRHVSPYAGNFEKVKALSSHNIEMILESLLAEKKALKKYKKNEREKYKMLLNANLSREEIETIYDEFRANINEINKEIEYLKGGIKYMHFLLTIVDDSKYSEILDNDKLVYVGIESPENIKPEDIDE